MGSSYRISSDSSKLIHAFDFPSLSLLFMLKWYISRSMLSLKKCLGTEGLFFVDDIEITSRAPWIHATKSFLFLSGLPSRVRQDTLTLEPSSWWKPPGIKMIHPSILIKAFHHFLEVILGIVAIPRYPELEEIKMSLIPWFFHRWPWLFRRSMYRTRAVLWF